MKYQLKAVPFVRDDPIPSKWQERTDIIISDLDETALGPNIEFVLIIIGDKEWLVNRKEVIRVAKSL